MSVRLHPGTIEETDWKLTIATHSGQGGAILLFLLIYSIYQYNGDLPESIDAEHAPSAAGVSVPVSVTGGGRTGEVSTGLEEKAGFSAWDCAGCFPSPHDISHRQNAQQHSSRLPQA